MITRSKALYFHKKYPSGLSNEEYDFIKSIVGQIEFETGVKVKMEYAGVGALKLVIHTTAKDYDFKKTYLNLKKIGFPLLAMKDSIVDVKAKLDGVLAILAYEESDESIDEAHPRFNYHVQYGNRPQFAHDSVFLEKILRKFASIDEVTEEKVILEIDKRAA